jgi:hypothetical protein
MNIMNMAVFRLPPDDYVGFSCLEGDVVKVSVKEPVLSSDVYAFLHVVSRFSVVPSHPS